MSTGMPTLSLNRTRLHVDVWSRNTLRYNVRVECNFRNEFFFSATNESFLKQIILFYEFYGCVQVPNEACQSDLMHFREKFGCFENPVTNVERKLRSIRVMGLFCFSRKS